MKSMAERKLLTALLFVLGNLVLNQRTFGRNKTRGFSDPGSLF